LGHALDGLFDEWSCREYGIELASLKAQLCEANELFKRATDTLKGKSRAMIDYYASDLVDIAAWLINSWLLLQDGALQESRCDLARAYIMANLPNIHRAAEIIFAADETPMQLHEKMLAS
jgi:hypothetical protein